MHSASHRNARHTEISASRVLALRCARSRPTSAIRARRPAQSAGSSTVKVAPSPGRRVQLDRPLVSLHYRLDDGKTRPGPARAGPGRFGSVEAVEGPGRVLGGQTGPLVGHVDDHSARPSPSSHPHRCAGFGVNQGVGQQVVEHPGEVAPMPLYLQPPRDDVELAPVTASSSSTCPPRHRRLESCSLMRVAGPSASDDGRHRR